MRSYGESCGIAHAFDLIGDRWAGLVIRELLLGPKRFTDLAADLPNASPSVLSGCLRKLVAHDVVERRAGPPPGRGQLYRLTTWGQRLRPILIALGDWALGSAAFQPSAPLSDDAAALAFAAHCVANDLDWTADYELRIGRGVFVARVGDGELEVERGAARDPAAVLACDARRFVAVLGPSPRRPLSDDEVVGDVAGLRRLLAAVRFDGQPALRS